MNELAMIFNHLGIATSDVLKAAGTKWNFLAFSPGLVGGHCVAVDAYHLAARAEMEGYNPQVVLAGRRTNDGMGGFVAWRLARILVASGRHVRGARIGILGLTFKENVRDIRNSRVPDIVRELQAWGAQVLVHDPLASPQEAIREYGIELVDEAKLKELDGIVLAVAHDSYIKKNAHLCNYVIPGGAIVDIKSVLNAKALNLRYAYWAL